MPLTKIPFKPGINKEVTEYANEGGYYDCNLIRFRFGYAEKIGGWANTNYVYAQQHNTSQPTYTFPGVANSLIDWVNYNSENLIGFGTTQGFFVQNGIGTAYHNITPVAQVLSLPANSFTSTTVGSPVLTVTAPNNGLQTGTIVFFAPTSGTSTSTTIDGITVTFGQQTTVGAQYYVVISASLDSFQIIGSGYATSGGVTGGIAVTLTCMANCEFGTSVTSYAWGIGQWGLGQWGIGVGTSVNYGTFTGGAGRVWTQYNFGQDLIMSLFGNPIYYWVNDTIGYTPAVTLSSYATTQNYNSVNVTTGVTGSNTITVDFNDYVYPGEVITFNGSIPPGGDIPTGTYVVSITGLQVTLSGNVNIPTGSSLNLSYSFLYVPNTTNKVFVSSIYQFVICLGANPYDPTNSNTQYDPLLVRWSDQTVPSQWIPLATNQAGEQPLSSGSRLMTVVNNLQIILLFTDTAVYQMQYIGAPYVWSFTLIQDNISIISQNAAITANNVTWWMGTDKFYMYNGTVQVLPCSLRRYVFSNINKDQAWQTVVGYNEGFSEIWWFYPSLTSTVNDSYVKFNFVDNVWDYGSLNRSAWLGTSLQAYPMGAYSTQTTYTTALVNSSYIPTIQVADSSSFPQQGTIVIGNEIIAYTGNTGTSFTGCTRGAYGSTPNLTIQAYTPVMDVVPNQIMFHEYGVDNNSVFGVTLPVVSYIQSSDVSIGDGEHFASVWRILPDLTFINSSSQNPQMTLTVLPRLNSGTPYQQSVDQPPVKNVRNYGVVPQYPIEQFTGQVYTRVRGRQMALRMDTGLVNDAYLIYGYPSTALGVMWQLGNIRLDIRPDGRR